MFVFRLSRVLARFNGITGRLFIIFDSIQAYLAVLFRRKLFRIFFGLTTLSLAISAVPYLFSEYNPTLPHILSHSLFVLAILANATMLITDKVSKVFHSIYISIELGVFDNFQYVLAEKVKSLANVCRKSQTGNLNLNMLAVLIGLAAIVIMTIWSIT